MGASLPLFAVQGGEEDGRTRMIPRQRLPPRVLCGRRPSRLFLRTGAREPPENDGAPCQPGLDGLFQALPCKRVMGECSGWGGVRGEGDR